MYIRWHGYSCFEFADDKNNVVFDPHDGKSIGVFPPKVSAKLALCTHNTFDRNAFRVVGGKHKDVVCERGEFEENGFEYIGLPSFSDDRLGEQRGANTIYLFSMDGISVAICGCLGDIPIDWVMERIRGVDLLFVPVGEYWTMPIYKVNEFISKQLNDYLHIHKDIADSIENKIKEAVKEREEINEIRNSNKTKKSGSFFNANLNDCRVHYCDRRTKANEEFIDLTSVFITEGKSASGTVNKARNPVYQAVFSIRGKSKNSFKSSEAKVIENVELRNLVGALGISEGLNGLRFNKVILATDADNDGMHIRMLLMTFLLKYYRELVETGHVYILETPLFRVKNKKESKYCFTREEKDAAFEEMVKRDSKTEITRFKGLGEISEKEFKDFIGEKMRAEQVSIHEGEDIHMLLTFYMGQNTYERQQFILREMKSEEEMEGTNI